jgi:methionine-rich copper-binding protein CopC
MRRPVSGGASAFATMVRVPSPHHRLPHLIAVILLGAAVALTGTVPASALALHAQLVSTDPADGSSAPTVSDVTLTFSEPINAQFLKVVVEGPDGPETAGEPVVDGGEVSQALVADLPAGTHTVTYRVVSVDGHPVSGVITFTTTQGPSSQPTPSTPEPRPSVSAPASASGSSSASSTSSPAVETGSTASPGSLPGWLPVLLAIAVLGLLAALVIGLRTRSRSRREYPDD